MRIVELINSLDIGGAERMVVDLSIGLHRQGHKVTVVCLRTPGLLKAPLDAAGVEVIALQKGSGVSIGTLRALTRVVSKVNADVVHTHNPIVHHYGTAAARATRTPVVVGTLHGPGNLNQPPGKTE